MQLFRHMRLDDLVENVLERDACPQELDAAGVHRPQKRAAGAIDAGDVFQIDGEPAFHQQQCFAVQLARLNLIIDLQNPGPDRADCQPKAGPARGLEEKVALPKPGCPHSGRCRSGGSYPSAGRPPIGLARRTARKIACAMASAPATPRVLMSARNSPQERAKVVSPSAMVFTG